MPNRYIIQTDLDGRHAVYHGGLVVSHFYDLETAKTVVQYLNSSSLNHFGAAEEQRKDRANVTDPVRYGQALHEALVAGFRDDGF